MKQTLNAVKNEKGFTLVEIIAVLVILGILAAVAVPKYFDMQENAERKTVKGAYADMQSKLSGTFASKLLENDGEVDESDYNTFSAIGVISADAVYKDFPGTWDGGGDSAELTYTLATGSGDEFTFTIVTNTDEPPGEITVSSTGDDL